MCRCLSQAPCRTPGSRCGIFPAAALFGAIQAAFNPQFLIGRADAFLWPGHQSATPKAAHFDRQLSARRVLQHPRELLAAIGPAEQACQCREGCWTALHGHKAGHHASLPAVEGRPASLRDKSVPSGRVGDVCIFSHDLAAGQAVGSVQRFRNLHADIEPFVERLAQTVRLVVEALDVRALDRPFDDRLAEIILLDTAALKLDCRQFTLRLPARQVFRQGFRQRLRSSALRHRALPRDHERRARPYAGHIALHCLAVGADLSLETKGDISLGSLYPLAAGDLDRASVG